MPNWCSTTIWLTMPKDKLEELNKFEELLDEPPPHTRDFSRE